MNALKKINQETDKPALFNLLKDGTLILCEQSNQFVFVKKVGDNLSTKIVQLKQNMGKGVAPYKPIKLHLGIVRDLINKENIEDYYNGKYEMLDITVENLLKSFDNGILDIRHCKSKGRMEGYDVLIKSWYVFDGTARNIALITF